MNYTYNQYALKKDYLTLLFDQAMVMEDMNIENPVDFSNEIRALMIDAAK